MNTKRRPEKIIGIGEILWDMLPEGRQLGGAPANFAFHTRQFGFDTGVISAVGRDVEGKDILEIILKSGIRSFVGVNDKPTGTVSVSVNKEGIPVYTIHENVAWDFINALDDAMEWVIEASAICFGSLAQRSEFSRRTIYNVLDNAPRTCLKVFDINLRQNFYSKEVIGTSLQKASILKINDEEIYVLGEMFGLGEKEEDIASKAIDTFNLDYLTLTKGSKGSYMYSKSGSSWLPTPRVKVVDTVGAGDSFTAAMVSGILSGKGLEEIHRLAVEVSAFVCTCAGGTPVLPEHICIKI